MPVPSHVISSNKQRSARNQTQKCYKTEINVNALRCDSVNISGCGHTEVDSELYSTINIRLHPHQQCTLSAGSQRKHAVDPGVADIDFVDKSYNY